MRQRFATLRCRLFGHDSGTFSFTSNFDVYGRPLRNGLFTIDSRCRRCHTYVGVTVPDRFTIQSPAWRAAEDFKAAMQRLVSEPGLSADGVVAAQAGIEALAATPAWCPCGHALDSDLRCLNGRIYGPCDSPHCDGPCTDTYGVCDADICACLGEDEDE